MDQNQGLQWLQSLPPEAQTTYKNWLMLENAKPSKNGDSRTSERKYKALGGDSARNAAASVLQQSYPQVWEFANKPENQIKTGGLGQGADILAMLAAIGTAGATGLITPAGGVAAGGATIPGGMTAVGGGLADTSGAVLAGGAGAGQGLGLSTLGTALTPAQAAAASGQAADYIAAGGNSATNIASGGSLLPALTSIPAQSVPSSGNSLSSLLTNGTGALTSLIGSDQAANAAREAQAQQEARAREAISGMTSAQQQGAGLMDTAYADARGQNASMFERGNALQDKQFQTGSQGIQAAKNEGLGYLDSGYGSAIEGINGAVGSSNALLDPWYQRGNAAGGAQADLMGLGSNGAEGQLAALMNSPGYKFRLQQGQKGLDASLAARGGMGSGKAAQGASEFNQNYASNEYGNRLQQLGGVSGQGLSAAGQMGSNTMSGANTVAGLRTNQGNNKANLVTGAANSLASLGSSYANNQTQRGDTFANNNQNLGMTFAGNQANSLGNLANNSANILTGLGNAQGASSIAQGNAQQSGWLGAGNALNSWLNPTPKYGWRPDNTYGPMGG